jgi:class 3 adenylate cyclase
VSDLPSGTVTFLFTDVERSTELVRRHGERYVDLLAAARSHLRAAFAEHGGREVDTQGDSFFVVFTRAREAALAAISAQRALAAHPWPDGGALRVRMGLHTTEPHRWSQGYVGVGVHRAARICSVGHGGQILLSRSTAGLVADDELDGVAIRDLGAHRLRDLQGVERIFQLVVDGLAAEFPPLATVEGAGSGTETATIVFGDVQGFTALGRELTPEVFRALVAQLQRTLETTFEEAGARGIFVFADSAMGVFRSARAALEAAVSLHRAVTEREWPGGRRLAVHVAVNSGEVIATAHGYFSAAVNRAAALCEHARGRILVSETTRNLLEEDETLVVRDAGVVTLQSGEIRVYEIVVPRSLEEALETLATAHEMQELGPPG